MSQGRPQPWQGPGGAGSSRRRTHAMVVALYTVLALVLTWPLVRHLSTHVPGSYTWAFDEYTFLWNSWWFRYSLLNLEQNPLYSTHTFYPLGISLALYTYNLFNVALSVPLQPFLTLPAISNLTFLFTTVFSGYGTFLLVEYLLARGPAAGRRRIAIAAAFLAGLIYAFGSYRMVYAAIGHYNLWSTAWVPFFALYLIRTLREPGWRNAALTGLFLALSLLCDMMLGVFLGLLALIVVLWAVGRRERREIAGGWTGLARRLVIVGLVALVLYLPLLVPVLREMSGGYELPGWGDAERLSVDLVGLVSPTALHPLGGTWDQALRQAREGTGRFRDVHTVFLGWTGLALAAIGAACYRRRLAAWITGFVTFAVFSLGPLLQVNGRSTFNLDGLSTTVPLPFILLHYLPVIKANRVSNRFSVVLMLTLAVLAGFGAFWLLAKVAGNGRRLPVRQVVTGTCVALLGGLLLFDHWSAPLPLTDARIPEVYTEIAADRGDFAVLQLPLGWRNSFGILGSESTQTQYYQSYHHKRLLSGNISRNPPFKFDYFRRLPILDSLIVIQTSGHVDAERRAADRSTAAEMLDFYDIRYVVVAPGVPGRPPYVDTRAEAVAYIEEVLPLEKVYDRDGWLLYRTVPATVPAEMTIDLGGSELATAMAIGEGWGEAEAIQGVAGRWATASESRLFLPGQSGSSYRLTVTAMPFNYPGAGPQRAALRVNGHRLPTSHPLTPGWGTYAWDVPSSLVRDGLNDLTLLFDHAAAPADVLPGDGAIGATGIRVPVPIEVNSGGPADFAYISIGSPTGGEAADGSDHRPGYNVAVIHPRTGRLLERRGFDTSPGGSDAEAEDLAGFIAAIPEGRIVAVALQGNGAVHLTDSAVAALRSIGSQIDPRGQTGWSHAIIGVKGAKVGSALEAAGAGNGWLRAAPDRRTLAAAVDQVQWQLVGK